MSQLDSAPDVDWADHLGSIYDDLAFFSTELGSWGRDYLKIHRPRFRADLELIASEHEGGSILEIGALPYVTTICLARAGYSISAVDLDPERGKAIIERYQLQVSKCDIETEPLPYPQESFDLIVLAEVFEHLRIDPLTSLQRISEVLRPGGKLILTTPNFYSLPNISRFLRGKGVIDAYTEFSKLHTIGHMGHVHEYTSNELRQFLASRGFAIDRIIYRSFWHKSGRLRGQIQRMALWAFPKLHPFVAVVARKL